MAQGTPVVATPANSCPGLIGWYHVVWNACKFTSAVPAPDIQPKFYPAAAPSGYSAEELMAPAGLDAAQVPNNIYNVVPKYFCTTGVTTGIPSSYNPKGPAFRTTTCRRAIDQFGRSAQRCQATNIGAWPSAAGTLVQSKALIYLANQFNTDAPWCSS